MTAAEVAAMIRRIRTHTRCVTYPEYTEPVLVIGGEVFINVSAPSSTGKIYARFLRPAKDADSTELPKRRF